MASTTPTQNAKVLPERRYFTNCSRCSSLEVVDGTQPPTFCPRCRANDGFTWWPADQWPDIFVRALQNQMTGG